MMEIFGMMSGVWFDGVNVVGGFGGNVFKGFW